jgi:hypothetical protein
LRAKIGRGAHQEPQAGKRSEGDLGLGASAGVQGAGPESSTIGARAIPLREPAASGRAEDFNVHERNLRKGGRGDQVGETRDR